MTDPDLVTLAEFEQAIELTKTGRYQLKLFVSGSTEKSSRAIANIHALCEERLAGRYQLEVIDIYQQPHMAREGQVIAAPTLVKELPEPVRRFVGDLSDQGRVLLGLDIRLVD